MTNMCGCVQQAEVGKLHRMQGGMGQGEMGQDGLGLVKRGAGRGETWGGTRCVRKGVATNAACRQRAAIP